jgi:hypothetical protein
MQRALEQAHEDIAFLRSRIELHIGQLNAAVRPGGDDAVVGQHEAHATRPPGDDAIAGAQQHARRGRHRDIGALDRGRAGDALDHAGDTGFRSDGGRSAGHQGRCRANDGGALPVNSHVHGVLTLVMAERGL